MASAFMARYSPKVPTIHLDELEAKPQTIVAFAREYPSCHLVELHRHERAQLIYATQGVMRVDTPVGIWVVPPMRAIWVPPGIDHEIRASSTLQLRTLFVRWPLQRSLPDECCVIEVSSLLRELILRLVTLGASRELPGDTGPMIEVIFEEMRRVKVLPMHVPLPVDARAKKVCYGILDNPADTRTSAQWGKSVGASSRTLERLFKGEARTSFREWRQQVRLLAALQRLAEYTPISVVAADLGYSSASAFTAMFKRTLGCPPRDFFPQEMVHE
ncbi:AraC family transcriptional regulator [Steroidobacter sp.]|uniref:AraC family transcriptional regulator n=1 Tax=Steroidobacter sp. TaxID=1978227 RepID=UPI0025EC6200|nr:helix-turn-helix transcriptional regulator [Steroidobacter sp.]